MNRPYVCRILFSAVKENIRLSEKKTATISLIT